MKTNIKATNLQLTSAINSYLQNKLSHVNKLVKFDSADQPLAEVELGRETKHHKQGDIFRAEINLYLAGKTFRAVATEPDLYAAIDLAKDELMGQIKSGRDKKITLFRRGARQVKNFLRGLYKKDY